MLDLIRKFTSGLSRDEFYSFYSLMTSLAGPVCGDHIMVNGQLINLKKIVRKLRITVMYPRFNVDYAPAYTLIAAQADLDRLRSVYLSLSKLDEKATVAKLIGALEIVVTSIYNERKAF